MKFFVVFLALVGLGACADPEAEEGTCYSSVVSRCSAPGGGELDNCNAMYGSIHTIVEGSKEFNGKVEKDLQKFANSHIAHSFDYLLMSSHFGTYKTNRKGFEGLFRKLSDTMWNDAIEIIKHITKRGGVMDLNAMSSGPEASVTKTHELEEPHSLAKALDAQKNIAHEANRIHGEVTRQRDRFHDPEIASYLENNFVHKHADSIRELSGHSNDLAGLLKNSQDKSLSLFLFDEYLQKL